MKRQRLDSNIIRKIKKYSIAVLVSGAAMLFYGCEKNNIEQIKAFYSTENLPVLEAKNFETLVTDSGQVRYFIKAPKLLQFQDEGINYREFPEGVELVEYDDHKRIISSITADYAKHFVAEDKLEAKNNVVATNAQGDTLKTEHLIWEKKKDIIYTEEFVRIIRTDQIITGIGFTSDQKLQNWKIKNPKGTIYVNVKNEAQQNDTVLPTPESEMNLQNPSKGQLQFNK